MQCEITALYSYPVKSCQASSMQSVQLSELGIAGDRQLMVLRDGQFVNQKQLPLLARITTRRVSSSDIEFSATGHPDHSHRVNADGEQAVIDLYGTPIDVIRQSQSLGEWVSSVIGDRVELVSHSSTSTRHLPVPLLAGLDGLNHTGFVDVSPLLLTSEASLADLNGRLESSVDMDRFRPNIVIRGIEPWAEDTIQEYRFNTLSLHKQAHCERCAVTCTDQHSGARHPEPLRTLRAFRQSADAYSSGILFGVYLSIIGNGTLSVGDMLELPGQ